MNYDETLQPSPADFPSPVAHSQTAPDVAKQRPENAFKPDVRDFVFALVTFVLGYIFSRWVVFSWRGWGVAAFTTAYLISVTVYLIKKGTFARGAATWFWMAATWAAGISYALWDNPGTATLRVLFLLCAAAYYVITASGSTILGKTGNYLLVDGLNAIILIPIRNFVNQYVSFSYPKKPRQKRVKLLPIVIGIGIAIFLTGCLVPMLRNADSGGFAIVLDSIASIFKIDWQMIGDFLFYSLFAVPIAAYQYGLASGAAHRKGTDIIKPDSVKEITTSLRVAQPATIFIMLGTVCGVYLVFILCQIPYFFSAFTGQRPAGWLNFSEYARRGFFELCIVVVINLVVITFSNVTSKKTRIDSRLLKAFNIAFAIVTLVLIATAFSKMALYIDAFGLSIPRLLPCVFMVFLMLVFIALIALQKWDFSIVRFALVTGAVMLCALFVCNPDALVVRYNTSRYLSGTLREYDVEILRRAGTAGVLPALEVYEKTADAQLKQQISIYLDNQKQNASIYEYEQNLESYTAQKRLSDK